MSEWKEYMLVEITEPIKETYTPNGMDNLNYIGMEHIEQETLRLTEIGSSNDVTSTKFLFKANDVLFGKLRVYFRKVAKPKFNGICSTDIWVFRAKEDFDQNFLFYFLANWDFINTADGGEGGTRMPRADWNFLSTTKWNVPLLPEQKAIAGVLSSLDDKIDLLHRQNKTLEAMAETIFRQWFVEEAKEGWAEKPLDKIADYLNGLACQKYPPKNDIDKLPVLKIKDLRSGFTENSDWASTDIANEFIIENGDVIFSWSGSLMVKIWNGGKCILNQHLFKVTSTVYPKWFYYFWTKHHLEKFISIAESKSTTMGHIKREDLSNSIVLIPEETELIEMGSSISPMIDQIIIINKQIRILEKLREALLPKLMSGELRVKYE